MRDLIQKATATMQATTLAESDATAHSCTLLLHIKDMEQLTVSCSPSSFETPHIYRRSSLIGLRSSIRPFDLPHPLHPFILQVAHSICSFDESTRRCHQHREVREQYWGAHHDVRDGVGVCAHDLQRLACCGTFLRHLVAFHTPMVLTQLQRVLPTLMTWLLEIVRDESVEHRTLRSFTEKGCTWREGVYSFVNTALLLLSVMPHGTPAEIQAAVNTLPSGVIATMCCLACDAVPQVPLHVRAQDTTIPNWITEHDFAVCSFERLLASFIHNGTLLDCPEPIDPELFCPAAMEAVKRAVCAVHTTPDKTVNDAEATHSTLLRMFLYHSS